MDPQSASAVLMVRPARFGFNPQTAASNAFQHGEPGGDPQAAALEEFAALASTLREAGIKVLIAADTPEPAKPDAVFPNNWVSFHADGSVALYPMLAPNRRLERRDSVLEQVSREGFRITRTVDLSYRELQGKFLEGTGSLVLDRMHRIAYACISPRTDLDVLGEFAQLMDYELVTFEALDAHGQSIYHTNVLMAVCTDLAVVCDECIADSRSREAVLSRLRATGHDLLHITRAQMLAFAGNVLELAAPAGRVLALSTTAVHALSVEQRQMLEGHLTLLPVNIPHIEHVGGGGVRCMLAEIHLPARRMA
jgi:hypothetical protein